MAWNNDNNQNNRDRNNYNQGYNQSNFDQNSGQGNYNQNWHNQGGYDQNNYNQNYSQNNYQGYNQGYSQNNYQPGQPPGGTFPSIWPSQEELGRAVSSCLSRVFLRMFAALLVTAAVAYAVATSYSMQMFIFGNIAVFYALIIAELVLVILISFRINKLSPTVANAMFFVYAIINGMTLSVIFLVYDIGIIYHAFAVSALMFAAMALFGAATKKDLSSVGSICIMGLFGIIIASLVNLFLRSEMLDTIVCYIGVLIFVGLTAYDTQRIKRMLGEANAMSHEVAIKRISVIGALTLYLDFINLFLKILRLMGRRR